MLVLLSRFAYRFHLITAIRRMFAPSEIAFGDLCVQRFIPLAKSPLGEVTHNYWQKSCSQERRRKSERGSMISISPLILSVSPFLQGIKVPLRSTLFDKELTPSDKIETDFQTILKRSSFYENLISH